MLKTICPECNSFLSFFDNKLNNICKTINSYIDNNVNAYGKILFTENVENIKKCIIGHILAGFTIPEKANDQTLHKKGEYRRIFKDYLLNDKSLPDYMKLHYWYHLSDIIIFNPCFSYTPDYKILKESFTCSIIKFKPFAFMLVDYRETINYEFAFPILKSNNDKSFYLEYKSKYFIDEDYPFKVNSTGIILLSDENFYYARKIK